MSERRDRQSVRLKWYDYSSAGIYYVTICTANHRHFFGRIKNGKMYLNAAGFIAHSMWLTLLERFPGISLDAFVIMPNHMHGIIVIHRRTNVENMPKRFQPYMRKLMLERNPDMSRTYKPPTVGKIVRSYKGVVTYRIRKLGIKEFAWQRLYWSSIVFKKNTVVYVKRYISENPSKWEKDKLYKKAPEE